MIPFTLVTDSVIWLAPQHIVSVRPNERADGSIIRTINGDQWAVDSAPERITVLIRTELT